MSRVTASLQTNVRSAVPWICELNLAEMAQKVSSNGANAADCKQRRKCLNLGEIFLRHKDRLLYSLECFHQAFRSLGVEFLVKRHSIEEEEYPPHRTTPGKAANA